MATPFTVRATRASLLALALVALLWLLLARTAVSAPAFLYQITVDTPLDEYDLSGSGTGCALREAIHTANLGVNFGGCVRIATVIGTGADKIVLPAGVYTLTRSGAGEDFDVTGDLDVERSVVISATGAAAPVVTGNLGWTDRIFDVLTGTVSIKGLAIQQGYGSMGGALQVAPGASLTLIDSTVTDSQSSSDGGAIYVGIGGSVLLTNTRLLGNSAGTNGGAVFSQGTLTISSSYLAHNVSSGAGGGMWISGTTHIDGSTLYSNTAFGFGGAIYKQDGSLFGADLSLFENHSNQWGGGLAIAGGSANYLTNAAFTGNTAAGNGGAIFNASAGMVLVDASLSGNLGYAGGGIFNEGAMSLFDSTLSQNQATQTAGGGIFNEGTAALFGVTLSGNSAATYGGGFFNRSTAELKASTLEGNSAERGGGVYSDQGTADFVNVTLSGNSAAANGGGIYNHTAQARLLNVTLSGNAASSSLGGALYMESGYTTVLTNTIIAYSPSGGNCSGSVTLSKYSFSSDYTCALPSGNTIKGQNPNGLDPLLTALGNYGGPTLVHMLRVGSPAIDGVVGSDAPQTDQRGITRPQGAGYDIGAVEWRPEDLLKLYLPLIRR